MRRVGRLQYRGLQVSAGAAKLLPAKLAGRRGCIPSPTYRRAAQCCEGPAEAAFGIGQSAFTAIDEVSSDMLSPATVMRSGGLLDNAYHRGGDRARSLAQRLCVVPDKVLPRWWSNALPKPGLASAASPGRCRFAVAEIDLWGVARNGVVWLRSMRRNCH